MLHFDCKQEKSRTNIRTKIIFIEIKKKKNIKMSEIFQQQCSIETNEKLGRYVQAKCDLTTGDCLLLEEPILIMAATGDKRCNNCFKLAQNYCSICKITILCQNCNQHNQYDCQKLTVMTDLNRELLKQFNDAYGIIKCLLSLENPETQKYIQLMLQAECHLEKRRNTDIWNKHNEKIVKPILKSNIRKYLSNGPRINEDFLQQLCAYIDVNDFEIRAPDNGSMKGIYIKGALLSHDCTANTSIAIDDKYCMKIYANQNIKMGETITNCYTNVLLGTDERRRILLEGKYFHCTCNRCEDPTELGSHMSSLKCPSCFKGYMLKNPIENKWCCQICKHSQTCQAIELIIKNLQNDILQCPKDPYELEMLLQKLTHILHPQHYMIVDVKQHIASILRSIINDVGRCPGRKVYERKIILCKDIFKVLNLILPGLSRLKAIVLYEYASTWAEYNRLRYREKDLNKIELKDLLQESEQMLRDSIRMLLFEPKITPEGKLLHSMLQELKYLQTDMKMLK